jgi:hypothetical protein
MLRTWNVLCGEKQSLAASIDAAKSDLVACLAASVMATAAVRAVLPLHICVLASLSTGYTDAGAHA